MPHYLLCGERHIIGEADCAHDEAALAYAAGAIDGHAGAEVWEQAPDRLRAGAGLGGRNSRGRGWTTGLTCYSASHIRHAIQANTA